MERNLSQFAHNSAQSNDLLEKMMRGNEVVEWHSANRLFGQRGFDFRSSFLEVLSDGYGAPFEPADFANRAEQERLRINAWVEGQTKEKIRDLIPNGGVDASTRLVLVNALYLKAPWQDPFKEYATSNQPFYPGKDESAAVPTMARMADLDYLKGDGFTAVALPYQGGGLQFLVLLPDDRDGLSRLTAKVTPALLRTCARLRDPHLVSLYLPRFRLQGATIKLARELQALGMKTAFDLPPGSANFDRAAPRRPNGYLAISDVFHQTFIAVDEKGTEAAAATAVNELMGAFEPGANPPKPIVVRVDHPFFFAIQERTTGACLFVGSVSDPR